MDIRKFQIWMVVTTFVFFVWMWIFLNLENNIENTKPSSITKVKDKKEKWMKKIVAKETRLIIDSKCIGCGKCVRIDPQNFKMNYDTYKAEPIDSVNYIKSERLNRAIDICPVDSIHIIEI